MSTIIAPDEAHNCNRNKKSGRVAMLWRWIESYVDHQRGIFQ